MSLQSSEAHGDHEAPRVAGHGRNHRRIRGVRMDIRHGWVITSGTNGWSS